MSSEMHQTFGCCADVPEFLLHTGDAVDYPKWYIDYIRGLGERKVPGNAKKFLALLAENPSEWRRQIQGIRASTLIACIELGLVEDRPYGEETGTGGQYMEFRITGRGKDILINNYSLPD